MKQIFFVISILCVAGLSPIVSSQADQEKMNLEGLPLTGSLMERW